MRNEVGLVGLGEGAEARYQRVRESGGVIDAAKIELAIVKGRKEVKGMDAGCKAVLQIVGFAGVSVSEVADVAIEGRVADYGFGAGKFGGVVGWGAGHDGGIVGLDGGVDTGGFGVGGKRLVDECIEVGVCRDAGGRKDGAF